MLLSVLHSLVIFQSLKSMSTCWYYIICIGILHKIISTTPQNPPQKAWLKKKSWIPLHNRLKSFFDLKKRNKKFELTSLPSSFAPLAPPIVSNLVLFGNNRNKSRFNKKKEQERKWKKKQKKAAENMYHCVENSKTWKNTDQMLYKLFYRFFNISGPVEGPKNLGGRSLCILNKGQLI